jgi:hypothetical protein
MIQYTTTILKFGSQGEKTGWTYIVIPVDVAQKLMPENKKSFRVKGKLDATAIKGVALLPMGGGEFIMPLKADLRKKIGKRHGAILNVQIAIDKAEFKINADLLECLEDDEKAKAFFNKLTGSHQRYFSKWIDSAKTDATKAKRIAQCLNAFSKNQNYGEMLRALKSERGV